MFFFGKICFKPLQIMDDFHRPDGKIVERTVPASLETYIDKINEEEYETGNVENLEYIDKFKIRFFFPVQARRKFDGVESVEKKMAELANERPTILPMNEEINLDDLSMLQLFSEDVEEKTKIIYLADINNSKLKLIFRQFNIIY